MVVVCAPHVRAKWFRARELARRTAGEALPVWEAMEAVAAEVASAIPVEESGLEEGLAGAGAEGIGAGEAPRPTVAWVRPEAAHLGLPVRPRAGSWRARLRAGSLGTVGAAAANGCASQRASTQDEDCASTLQADGCAGQPAADGCPTQRDAADALPGLPPEVAALVDGLDACDAFELDLRLRRAVALERRFEARVGALLLVVAETRRQR